MSTFVLTIGAKGSAVAFSLTTGFYFCFSKGEPGKSGEKGLAGAPGLRVRSSCFHFMF